MRLYFVFFYQALCEAVSLLDHLCQKETSIVARVFDVIKRLSGRPIASLQPRVMLTIIQFFFNHSEFHLSVLFSFSSSVN